ncbi:hypothetical protein CR513_57191, partial [Mucuna pruriens]
MDESPVRPIKSHRRKKIGHLVSGSVVSMKTERAFNKKVKPWEFQEGELVLKKILPTQKDGRGKWMPNYEGPYVIKRAFSGGAIMLTTMDGRDLPHPINADIVKRFYP